MKNAIKIDNKIKISNIFWFLLYMIGLCIAAIAGLSLVPVPNKALVQIIMFLLLIIPVIGCLSLKIFTYEDSGEVITVKYYNPMKGTAYPAAEFPNRKLLNITAERILFGYILFLHIRSNSGKTIKLKYELIGFNRKQVDMLKQSLDNHDK